MGSGKRSTRRASTSILAPWRKRQHRNDESETALTIVVVASIADKTHTELKAILEAVRLDCLDAGLEDVKIELIDTIYIHRMRDVAIGLDDAAAIETWDEPSPRVVEYLATTGCQNKCSWTSIDFIRRVVSDDT
jgi:hypothetical protein